MIQHISAVTLAVHDIGRSIGFYEKLGFAVVYGGDPSAAFTTLRCGDAFVNLVATPGYARHWWGRVIFRVDDADAHHARLLAEGLKPGMPRDTMGRAILPHPRSGWA